MMYYELGSSPNPTGSIMNIIHEKYIENLDKLQGEIYIEKIIIS